PLSRDPTHSRWLFFNDPAPPEIYTLSLHDALPIYTGNPPARKLQQAAEGDGARPVCRGERPSATRGCAGHSAGIGASLVARRTADRKSTRLNSSHVKISYAVFCLKKKNKMHMDCIH